MSDSLIISNKDIIHITNVLQKKIRKKWRFDMKVNIKKLTETAIIPTYGDAGAAGADLYADVETPVYIGENEVVKISTGIAMEIPEGYVGLIYARSGLGCKHGLAPANKVGVIDSSYRGPIIVCLYNHEKYDHKNYDERYAEDYARRHTINQGDRIAQIVITPYVTAEFNEVEELVSSDRGEGGFGSTGR